MQKLQTKQSIVNTVIEELQHPSYMVCLEGSERFFKLDGSASEMSYKRASACLEYEVNARCRKRSEEVGIQYFEPESRTMIGITTKILKVVMAKNIIHEVYETMPGWQEGLVEWEQKRFLIRRSLAPRTAVKGPWDDVRIFWESFFGIGTGDPYAEQQLHAFYCLLRAKYLQMESPDSQRGSCPMLVMISDPNAGKTFAMRLVAQFLGQTQKTVDPTAERNGWSDACLASPVLFYDEASQDSYDFGKGLSREKLAEAFKRFEYTDLPLIAKRGRTAQNLPTVWFVARAVNPDSRAAILQTPLPSQNGMSDKLILAKVYRATVPFMGKEDPESRRKRVEILESQLPAFGYWLMHEFPKERRDDWIRDENGEEYRNQAHPFSHPEALEILSVSENDSSKELAILALLEAWSGSEGCRINISRFSAGEMYHAAVHEAGKGFGVYYAATAFCRFFDSAEKVGRCLSNLVSKPDSPVSKKKSGKDSWYSYQQVPETPAEGGEG